MFCTITCNSITGLDTVILIFRPQSSVIIHTPRVARVITIYWDIFYNATSGNVKARSRLRIDGELGKVLVGAKYVLVLVLYIMGKWSSASKRTQPVPPA